MSQLSMHSTRWMLVTDLDGTLLGDPDATSRFREWWRGGVKFRTLIYASGRRYESVVESIREHQLPEPDAVIADVGTDVRLYSTGAPLIEWTKRWWSTWEMDRIRRVLDSQPEFELQPFHCQTPYKRSYFVRSSLPGWLTRVRSLLREQNLSADLIFSSNRDLDVLPAGVNKGTAVEFLAQKWRIGRPRVIVAGDSGNDLSMFVQGFRGIVVANAQSEMSDLEGPNIYHSPLDFADGVIDGLEHWLRQGYLRLVVEPA